MPNHSVNRSLSQPLTASIAARIIATNCLLTLMLFAPTHLSAAAEDLLGTKPIIDFNDLSQLRNKQKMSASSIAGISEQNTLKVGGFLRHTANKAATPEGIQSNAFVRVKEQHLVQVYFNLKSTAEPEVEELRRLGAEIEIINNSLGKVQAWVDIATINALLSLENVVSVKTPKYATARTGRINSQGDAILRANQLRSMGFRGQGVKVGVVSDGANSWTAARNSGDLPANLTRYGSCSPTAMDAANCVSAKTCNEGTAMAEIIHDLAPDAQIAVAAASTSLEFIQGINQLANTFKADIIVDDLGFFGEPYFEDGDLADAVDALPRGVLYISSAGNSGVNHYEAEYNFVALEEINAHNFGSSTPDHSMGFVVPARGFVVTTLQWNDPFDSPSNNYDLYITSRTTVVGQSKDDQSVPGAAPIEAVCAYNPSSRDVINFVFIDRFAGADKRLELFLLGSPAIEYSRPAGSIFGHAGLPRTLAIGAINASEPGNNSIAPYSSRGPARIDFPSREDRAKPDLIGIDGVNVTGAGGFGSPFFGTSAAAPHVAAVAAQLMSVSKRVTASNVRDALSQGSVDLGSAGLDSIYGYGRVDALSAKANLKVGTPLPPLLLLLDD